MLRQPVVNGLAPSLPSSLLTNVWRPLALSHQHYAQHCISSRQSCSQICIPAALRRITRTLVDHRCLNASSDRSGSSSTESSTRSSSSDGNSSLPTSSESNESQPSSGAAASLLPPGVGDVPLVEASSVLEEERESRNTGTEPKPQQIEEGEEQYDEEGEFQGEHSFPGPADLAELHLVCSVAL